MSTGTIIRLGPHPHRTGFDVFKGELEPTFPGAPGGGSDFVAPAGSSAAELKPYLIEEIEKAMKGLTPSNNPALDMRAMLSDLIEKIEAATFTLVDAPAERP